MTPGLTLQSLIRTGNGVEKAMICVRPLNILVVEIFGDVDAKFKWDISVMLSIGTATNSFCASMTTTDCGNGIQARSNTRCTFNRLDTVGRDRGILDEPSV